MHARCCAGSLDDVETRFSFQPQNAPNDACRGTEFILNFNAILETSKC